MISRNVIADDSTVYAEHIELNLLRTGVVQCAFCAHIIVWITVCPTFVQNASMTHINTFRGTKNHPKIQCPNDSSFRLQWISNLSAFRRFEIWSRQWSWRIHTRTRNGIWSNTRVVFDFWLHFLISEQMERVDQPHIGYKMPFNLLHLYWWLICPIEMWWMKGNAITWNTRCHILLAVFLLIQKVNDKMWMCSTLYIVGMCGNDESLFDGTSFSLHEMMM